MTQFYSPSTGAFMNDQDFGPRTLTVVDENAQAHALAALAASEDAMLTVLEEAQQAAVDALKAGDAPATGDGVETDVDRAIAALARIAAERAELVRNPPMTTVANSACRLPEDAFEISAEQHAAMLDAVNRGETFSIDAAGVVALQEATVSTEAVMRAVRAARAARDRALAASDWTMVSDAPLSPAQKAAWRKYRKHLRDGLPAVVKGLLGDTEALTVLGGIDDLVAHGRPS